MALVCLYQQFCVFVAVCMPGVFSVCLLVCVCQVFALCFCWCVYARCLLSPVYCVYCLLVWTLLLTLLALSAPHTHPKVRGQDFGQEGGLSVTLHIHLQVSVERSGQKHKQMKSCHIHPVFFKWVDARGETIGCISHKSGIDILHVYVTIAIVRDDRCYAAIALSHISDHAAMAGSSCDEMIRGL